MSSEADKLVDEKAIAEHFGVNRAAWIRAVRFRGCPHYRLGRLVVYHGDKLVKWLDENLETRQGGVRSGGSRSGPKLPRFDPVLKNGRGVLETISAEPSFSTISPQEFVQRASRMIRWLGFGPPERFDFEQERIERLAREKGGGE